MLFVHSRMVRCPVGQSVIITETAPRLASGMDTDTGADTRTDTGRRTDKDFSPHAWNIFSIKLLYIT